MAPPKSRLIPLTDQAMWLRFIPGFDVQVQGKKLIGRGRLRPLEITDEYTVEIQYKLGEGPHVYILDPPLQYRNGVRAEHMYGDNEPCLYLPRSGEWRQSKLLTETIVPWTMLWLAFYETWLVTGEWDGGGVHPAPTTRTKNDSSGKSNE